MRPPWDDTIKARIRRWWAAQVAGKLKEMERDGEVKRVAGRQKGVVYWTVT